MNFFHHLDPIQTEDESFHMDLHDVGLFLHLSPFSRDPLHLDEMYLEH